MEIRNSLGRFLSIFFIVAIGVAFFSGIRSTDPDMLYSGDAYFDEKNLMDIQVVGTLGLTEEDEEALAAVDGIEKVEGGYSTDAVCLANDSQKVVHIMSILPTMNVMTVEEGRMPETEDECVLDADFLPESGYDIGDEITFSSGTEDEITDTLVTDTFTIVGTVSSPCYISFSRGSTSIGTGSVSGFVGVLAESFDMDVYTELYASVKGAKELTAFTDEYEDCVAEVTDRVEAIREDREEARYDQLIRDANEELDKEKKELEDGKAEADAKLADTKAQIDDGWAQLNAAKAQIASSQAELESSKEKLVSGQAELDENVANVNARIDALNEKIAELNLAKEQYQALLDSGMLDEETLRGMESQITEGEAQIADASRQIEEARAQFEAAQAEINSGWEQIADGECQLADAEAQIEGKDQELLDAQAEYESAKAEAEQEIADGEKKIQEAEDEISKIDHAKWYIRDRDDNNDYTGYGENADRMRAIGQVFPVLFFLVAALISLTTMTRMVEEQRVQIGTLKALGYDKNAIAGKYLGYACLATITGSIVGVLFGEKVFPFIIITAYGILYQHMHNVVIPYNMYYALIASIAALACTMLATFFSCHRELKEQAAELMRPPAPKSGKRIFLEKISAVWRRLNFSWKATIRNLVRYKKRFFMTVFGIGGCMALLLVGFGLKDSIFDIGRLQYHQLQMYDGNLILNEDASDAEKDEACETLAEDSRVEATERSLLQQVTISSDSAKKDVYLNVPEDVESFPVFVELRDRITKERYFLEDEGVVLTEKTADKLDVEAGDTICIQDDIKGEIEVTISAVCENYMYHYLYMTPALYEKLYGKAPEYNSVYFLMKEEKGGETKDVGETVLKKEGALSISYTNDIEQQLNDMLGSLNIVLIVLVISAGLLAFVVLYNLNNINITERKRELATLKVLGFYPGEVAAYVYRENVILTILGAFAGMIFGKFLHQFVIVTVEIESAMFGRNIDLSSFVYGFFITVGFSILVNGVMYFKLKKIDMVESLKSVE